MDELIAWLRVQLDDDERVAQGSTCGPWMAKRADRSVYAQETSVVMGGHDGGWHIVPCQEEGGEGIEPGDAQHIARWDPARALTEVEAKRRILDRYEDALVRQQDPEHSQIAADIQVGEYDDWVLPLLALPYADRPGYREEWKPVSGS